MTLCAIFCREHVHKAHAWLIGARAVNSYPTGWLKLFGAGCIAGRLIGGAVSSASPDGA
jgi:hypothetical protein